MDKQILFRLWDYESNGYLDGWVLHPDGNIEFPEAGWDLLGHYENPKDYKLEQYIGFRDKNGKKIFEGDRLKTDNNPKDVRIIECITHASYWGIEEGEEERFEIIGNVNQN